jgi:uncharacterized protein
VKKRNYIQIDPINIDTDVAIGVPFPFNAEGVFYSTYTTKEQVKSNLINVLLTEPGERLYNPRFGVGIRSLLFENNINTSNLKERINNQINVYVPEIDLLDIKADKSPDSHDLYVKIDYRMAINNEQDSIIVNFNTGESNDSTAGIAQTNSAGY